MGVQVYRTTRFPPPGLAPSVCSMVFGGEAVVQLLENHNPPLLFQTVIPIISLPPPASPLSVIVTWSVALPSMGMTIFGFVMSWIFALPLNVAMQGEDRVGVVQGDGCTASDVMAFPLIWYTWPPLRTMV